MFRHILFKIESLLFKKRAFAVLLSEASVVQAALDKQNPSALKRNLVFCSVKYNHVLTF
jgi:hypothetical protein